MKDLVPCDLDILNIIAYNLSIYKLDHPDLTVSNLMEIISRRGVEDNSPVLYPGVQSLKV